MIDITMVSSAISSVKTLYEIANGMLVASKDGAVNAKAAELLTAISEIQGRLFDAQQTIMLMQEELRNAKADLAQRAQFDRYMLVEPFHGTKVYTVKPEALMINEPNHFICPNCKDVLNKLSILQEDGGAAFCKNKDCGQVYDIGT